MAEPTDDADKKPTKKPVTPASSAAGAVPPVEPAPSTPRKRTSSEKPESSTPIPPLVDLTGHGSEAPSRPDPYAAPAANPYVQNSSTPQYAAPQYGGQPYQYGAPAGQPKGLAITSMVLGIVSIVCCWIGLVAIAAIITGHLAQRSQPHARGFWLTGLITGYVGLGISLLYGVFFVISILADSSYNYSY
jgi:hypothetical protein